MTLYLLFDSVRYKKAVYAFIYAASVICGLVLAIIYYPAMLSHIFGGYRGREAREAFFDVSNLRDRAGLFIGILDEYLLHGMFYILLLVLLILYITMHYLHNRKAVDIHRADGEASVTVPEDRIRTENRITRAKVTLICTVTIGYFVVVLKTALMNAEEALRYELPVYGLMILLIVYALYVGMNRQIRAYMAIIVITAVMQLAGLCKDKVIFLYEDDAAGYEWAASHSDDTIVYIYNGTNEWMMWDDATELMQYDRIFCIDAENAQNITDSDVLASDTIYVYAVRNKAAEDKLNKLSETSGLHIVNKLRELQYVDLYMLK